MDAKGELPGTPNRYNVPTTFEGTVRYPSGVERVVANEGRGGVLIDGEVMVSVRLMANRTGGTIFRVSTWSQVPDTIMAPGRLPSRSRPPRIYTIEQVNFTDEVRQVEHRVPSDLEDRIQTSMASGRYASEDDLFRAALDTLESVESEAQGLQAAINAVKTGDAPVPLDDAFRALRQKYDLSTDV